MNLDLFTIKDLCFYYKLGKIEVQALKNINLSILKNDFVCFAGPSGSGKSTLLNLLGFIELPQGPQIQYHQKNIENFNELELNQIRLHQLGFIFQHFNLFNILTVYENVEYFLIQQGKHESERKLIVEDSIAKVGLWEHRHKRPNELSGGQKQRVAIARAIAKKPKLIIADEPTASLDQKTAEDIMNILLDLNQKNQVAVILASHDPLVFGLSKRIVKLKDGALV